MSITSVSSTGADTQAQAADQAKLNQMMAQYRAELKTGSASSLQSLGKQIAAEAKLLGQNVTLPTASSSSASAAPPATPSAGSSTVSVTA